MITKSQNHKITKSQNHKITKSVFVFSCFRERRGSVLLLALLILSSVLAATTAVSTLVVREIRSNKQIDDAVIAYYAAESGIEKGLWQIAVTPPSGPLTEPATTTSLSNDARITLQMNNVGTTIVIPFLAKNTKTNVDIYNPNGTTVETSAAGIMSLTIEKEEGAITVRCREWQGSAGAFTDACAGATIDANGISGLTADRAYRVTLEAGNDDVRRIRVSGMKADGSGLAQLPTQLTIESTGAFTTSRQALRITLPSPSFLDTYTP